MGQGGDHQYVELRACFWQILFVVARMIGTLLLSRSSLYFASYISYMSYTFIYYTFIHILHLHFLYYYYIFFLYILYFASCISWH